MHRITSSHCTRRFTRRGASAMFALAASVFAGFAAAQTADNVTLEFGDGNFITGTLVSFENGQYQVDSIAGLVTVPATSAACIGVACPALAAADEGDSKLILTSLDGSATIEGELVEIVNEQYLLATDVGDITINIADVTCEGARCANAQAAPVMGGDVTLVSTSNTLNGKLVDLLEDAFVVDVPILGVVRVSMDSYRCEGAGCP